MMRKKNNFLVWILFIVFACFTVTTAFAAVEKQKQQKKENKKEPPKEKEGAKLPSLPPAEKAVAVPSTASATFQLPDLPPNVPPVFHNPNPSIVEVQKQLADIVKIQQSLQLQQDQQIVEIQRIVEQAQAHQKLLGELEKARGKAGAGNQVDEAIRREKIQLIEEQATKNQAALEKLKEQGLPEKKFDKEAQETNSKPASQELAPFEEKPSQSDEEVVEPVLPPLPEPKKLEEKPKKSSWWWNSGK